jgi:aminodeoxyfutalosine synthase
MEAMTPEQLLETPDLISAGVAGDDVRRRMHGTRTTFNRVFEVHVDAPVHSLPPRVHAGEFRIVGRPGSLEVLLAAVRATVALAGATPVTVLSLADLALLPHPIRSVAGALKDAGAAAVVQFPIDLIENPELAAGDVQTGGLPILAISIDGIDHDRRLALCQAASDLQVNVGGFRAFAPLPRKMSVANPTTGYDDVKTVALARLVVQNIPSIQVDWALYGPKLAQVALTVGADDVDNVAAVDPGVLGTRRSPLEEIKGNIKAASLEAEERDGLFRVNSQPPKPNSQGRAD